ncbi:unnamed protein product [Urochloa humidicola]
MRREVEGDAPPVDSAGDEHIRRRFPASSAGPGSRTVGGAARGAPHARGRGGARARGGGGTTEMGPNRAVRRSCCWSHRRRAEVGEEKKVAAGKGRPRAQSAALLLPRWKERLRRSSPRAPPPSSSLPPPDPSRCTGADQLHRKVGQDPSSGPCGEGGCRRPNRAQPPPRRPEPPAAAPLVELTLARASTAPPAPLLASRLGANDAESERVRRRGRG